MLRQGQSVWFIPAVLGLMAICLLPGCGQEESKPVGGAVSKSSVRPTLFTALDAPRVAKATSVPDVIQPRAAVVKTSRSASTDLPQPVVIRSLSDMTVDILPAISKTRVGQVYGKVIMPKPVEIKSVPVPLPAETQTPAEPIGVVTAPSPPAVVSQPVESPAASVPAPEAMNERAAPVELVPAPVAQSPEVPVESAAPQSAATPESAQAKAQPEPQEAAPPAATPAPESPQPPAPVPVETPVATEPEAVAVEQSTATEVDDSPVTGELQPV